MAAVVETWRNCRLFMLSSWSGPSQLHQIGCVIRVQMTYRFSLIILATLLMINSLAEAKAGLLVTFEAGGVKDVRVARLAALYVPEKAAASPFIGPGAFRATFTGNLEMKIRDELSFSLAGRGNAKLMINGQKILELSGDSWRH